MEKKYYRIFFRIFPVENYKKYYRIFFRIFPVEN